MTRRTIGLVLLSLVLVGNGEALVPSHPTTHPEHAVWTQMRVADEVVQSINGLAIDSRLQAHVAFARRDVTYAAPQVIGWSEEIVAQGGAWPDLALDANDQPHIAYSGGFVNPHTTGYATRSGSWTTEWVDDVHGGGLDKIRIDSAGTPRIVYSGSGALRYASKLTIGWALEVIAPEPSFFFGFDLDANDKAHVAYQPTGSTLRYATNAGGSWVVTTIPAAGGSPDLAVDAAGDVHVTFQSTVGRLAYARLSGGVWQIESADVNSWTGLVSSIDVDSENRPHITYGDQYGSDSPFGAKARYATRLDDGTWSRSVVGPIGTTWGDPELRVGPDDIPRVLYRLGYTQGFTTNVDRLVLATAPVQSLPIS